MIALQSKVLTRYCVGALLPPDMSDDIIGSTRPPKHSNKDNEDEYIAYHYFVPER